MTKIFSLNSEKKLDFLSKITYVAFGTIPTIMLLVMAIRIERKTPILIIGVFIKFTYEICTKICFVMKKSTPIAIFMIYYENTVKNRRNI